jgi:hypothetical protein
VQYLICDPRNRRAESGNCASDRRKILNLSLVTRTPNFAAPWVRRFAGNWQASGIFTYSSGSWMTITSGVDNPLTGVGSGRPNVSGDWHVAQPTLSQWFNTAALTKNGPGAYGNAGTSIIPGPYGWNLDGAVWRTFPIREQVKADLRWEAFNVLNHARFNNPGTTLSNGNTFGEINSQAPRILQVALKITF